MHEENIELLREEAQRLLHVEIDLLEKMQNEPGVIAEARSGEQQTFDRTSLPKHIEVLQGELAKLEALEMVLAVVGTMKAGKSTTINAIVGTEVLPNRNRPMTALPTLIRHTPGQTEPLLRFENSQPINDLMIALHGVLKSPAAKEHLQNLERNQDMDELLSLIDKKIQFKQSYRGAEEIFWFLKSLNDLVRLTSELEVEFPFSCYDEIHEMPVIEVEFAHLREISKAHGRLTLLDTPGPNEAGQQHLRKMLTEQLRKASAVLAVLDFTQLKSDADAAVRKELEEIASVAKGRLYTLVNKFDQKDRHGDDEEQIKAFVAESLMQGMIQKTDVFPVSSRWGYLANRAKHEIFLHKSLPDHKKQPWVVDFAEEAFGRRWESKIEDIEEVQHHAELLWKDSLFSLPMENVIRSAHDRAAVFAIDSAAAKLVDNAEKLNKFLGVRESALTMSVQKLQQHITSVMGEIAKIESCEKATNEKVKNTLDGAQKNTSKVFEKIKKDAIKKLEEYFQEGKRIEREQLTKKKKRQEEKPQNIGGIFGGFLDTFNKIAETKREELDFDPENPIMKFDDAKEAKDLMRRIQESVEGEIRHAEESMQNSMSAVLDDFRGDFTKEIATSAQKIIDSMKDRMNNDGFSIDIKIPSTRSLALDFQANEMLEDVISENTRTVTRHRRQSGLWGGICRFFGTSDWGWEEYNEQERYFEIDIRKVQASVTTGIQKTFSGLDRSISEYIAKPLEVGVSEFFNEFKATIEQIRGDLLQSIRDQERSKAEQEALAQRLTNLKKNIPATLNDSLGLKSDVEPLMKADIQVPA